LADPDELTAALRSALTGKVASVAVAFSGGHDSSVLAHVARAACGDRPVRLLHVNHHLSPAADEMAAFAVAAGQRLELPVEVCDVTVGTAPRLSLEAAARDARYRALAGLIAPGEVLFTAHHADDQAETLLLQLLRGAGPLGLKGIEPDRAFGKGRLRRPFLALGRERLADYARTFGLTWYDDPSNEDIGFDRNYLRSEVLPRLRARWPAATRTLSRAARLQGECAAALTATALTCLARAEHDGRRLALNAFVGVPVELRREMVRVWLRGQGAPTPDAATLARIFEALVPYRGSGTPEAVLGTAALRRYRQHLYLTPASFPAAPAAPLSLAEAGVDGLPYGTLVIRRSSDGPRVDATLEDRLKIVFRRGGERVLAADGRHHVPLKQLLNLAAMPPWERTLVPLVALDGEIVAVPGVHVSPAVRACDRQEGFVFGWTRGGVGGRLR